MNEAAIFRPIGVGPGTRLIERYLVDRCAASDAVCAEFIAADMHRGNNQVLLTIFRQQLDPFKSSFEVLFKDLLAAKEIAHPNLLKKHSFEPAPGIGFLLASELTVGFRVSDLMRRRESFDEPSVLYLIYEIAKALDVIHQSKNVHANIQPRTVLLTAAGAVRLCWLGWSNLARQQGRIYCRNVPEVGERMLSPEELRNEPFGPAGDIYQLGLLAYQLITGVPAFSDVSQENLQGQILRNGASKLLPNRWGISEVLSGFVEKAVRIDRSERYQSAKAVLDELKPVMPATVRLNIYEEQSSLGEFSVLPKESPAASVKTAVLHSPSEADEERQLRDVSVRIFMGLLWLIPIQLGIALAEIIFILFVVVVMKSPLQRDPAGSMGRVIIFFHVTGLFLTAGLTFAELLPGTRKYVWRKTGLAENERSVPTRIFFSFLWYCLFQLFAFVPLIAFTEGNSIIVRRSSYSSFTEYLRAAFLNLSGSNIFVSILICVCLVLMLAAFDVLPGTGKYFRKTA